MSMLHALPLLAALVATSGFAQSPIPPPAAAAPTALEPVVVFAGPPGGPGSIEVYDALTGGILAGPGRLRDLQLLPLDFTGRTQLEELLPDRPRRHADLPAGATRLTLPFGQGSVYRYVRATPGGPRFGFLHVRAGVFPRALLELGGVGVAGTDPFLGTFGVAPDGSALLVATTLAAGGDLYEVGTARASLELRTGNVPPQEFSPNGLWLARDFGFGVAPTGIWRFPRVAGAAAAAVPAPQGTTWTGEAVMSRARRSAVVTSGTDPLQRDAWVFQATGPVTRASAAPAEIADAGFLPAFTSGPWMAVSDDGTLVGWVETFVDNQVAPPATWRDVRLAALAAPQSGELVTGDPYLLDTLDEVGRMLFFKPLELMFAAGEVNAPAEGGIGSADFFSATHGPGNVPIVRNLTVTSGDPTVPFTAGIPTLTPVVAHVTASGSVLIHDDDAEELITLDLLAGTIQTLDPDAKELYWVEPAGDWLVYALQRRNGQRPVEVHRVRRDLTGGSALLDAGSPQHLFERPVSLGATVVWVEVIGASQRLERATPSAGTVATWSPNPGVLVGPLGLTADGDVHFARAAGAASESRVWRNGAPDVVLLHPLRPGHWLP